MTTVSIKEARSRLSALARLAEQGRPVTVTRNGKPVCDLVAHRPQGRLKLKAVAQFKRKHGIKSVVRRVADDFDAPLPEDFLI